MTGESEVTEEKESILDDTKAQKAQRLLQDFFATHTEEWRSMAIPHIEVSNLSDDQLIDPEVIQPWVESLKQGILKPFLALQEKLEAEHLIPIQPRNTKLYEYTPEEIREIEEGRTVSRVHVIADMRCNHNCVHCSRGILASDPAQGKIRLLRVARAHNEEIKKQGVMIPTEDLVQLVQEGAQLGENGYPQLRELSLDGGEPLLDWPRIEAILSAMEQVNAGRDADKMMRLQIYTNGSTLTPAQIDRLASLPFTYLTINYISTNEQTFDWFTDTPGSYQRVTTNLEALVAAGKKYGRERWLMGALVPLEENKNELISTIAYLWERDITPIVQPMRIKERGEVNTQKGVVHPLNIEDHLIFLIEAWLWSLKKFMEDPNTKEGQGWLWRLDQIFPPNDPSLKKRSDPLRYSGEYTAFIKLFKENRPSYQMLLKLIGERVDWTFGEYGTPILNGIQHFTEIGHSWQKLYALHKEGVLRYDLRQASTLAKHDAPIKHALKGETPPANLGSQVAR